MSDESDVSGIPDTYEEFMQSGSTDDYKDAGNVQALRQRPQPPPQQTQAAPSPADIPDTFDMNSSLERRRKSKWTSRSTPARFRTTIEISSA